MSPAGTALEPGWRTTIGTSNYKKIFTDPRYREAFARTFVWTFVFSIVSVATTFALGLLLAMVFNNERMKGRRLYRSLIIIPYALPSFMTALVWKGMLNTQFGIINRMFGWSIPWLDGTIGINAIWPYVSILLVNLWLGFPYMFLVTTGALQSIPSDLKEAAFVDGATGFKAFRGVTFPLLLVAVAPLLIAQLRLQLQQLQPDLPADRGQATGPRQRDRPHRHPDLGGMEDRLRRRARAPTTAWPRPSP